MLNISHQRITMAANKFQYSSLKRVEKRNSGNVLVRLITIFFAIFIVAILLPWTQNIQSKGNVTTLKPSQRPQTIQSRISGRIEQWFVQEGDFVQQGDTILFISEIKSEYLDPQILDRVNSQIEAKEMSVQSYRDKVTTLEDQIIAVKKTALLKSTQLENKREQALLLIKSDSIEYEAAQIGFRIGKTQYHRMVKLHESGLKSLTDVESRNQTMQKAQAEMIAKENKRLTSQNKLINVEVEKVSVQMQYNEKIAKAESDKFAALSNLYEAEAVVAKLQNQYTNYSLRSEMYHITAPQNGYITKVIKSGIGETITEGAEIVSIMPADYELAIEMYIKPIDLPLLEKGQHIRIQFDGWPAIVFSGWPNTSYGTYGGSVYAIDNFISENGMYRIMVSQDPNDHAWPNGLRVGAGTKNMVLLKNVPIWYELWRKINGFPPDYYKTNEKKEK